MLKIDKILIIEDSKLFNNHLKKSLKSFTKEIIQAYSFKEGEEILENEDFDYIFLDLILPDGEGDELVEALPKKIRNKTIILTSDEDVERREYLFKLGILEYFSKLNPINLIINDIKHLILNLEDNKNYSVLIIDDSSFIRKTLKSVLEPRRYTLFFAKNAKEGEGILQKENIHLILLDIELPDKNGIEFLEEIKAQTKFLNLPVISISNNDNPILVARLLKHGAKDFIKKPFVSEYIILKCDLHIQNYKNVLLLKQKTKELEKLNKLKSEFFASISHEIRTPINAINGFIKLLNNMDLPDEAKKYTTILNETTDDLLRIINDALDFEKLENKQMKIEKIEFNLQKTVQTIKEIFSQNAKQKGLIFETDFENTNHNIISDPTRLKQVIINLLSNAFKFTPKNKKVILKAKLNNNKLYIEVYDEGIGIATDKIKTILKPFTQADESTTRKYGGTGLGLSVVNKIIHLLGGELEIESEVNKFSKFYFEIPVSVVQEKKLNILVAEDSEANQLFLEALLGRLNHNFKIVSNGKEALNEFQKAKYDIVILDENMPEMSGSEAAVKLKEINPDIKIISISGNKENNSIYDYILTKPFDLEKLNLILKEAQND